ncbi:hypothetical protein [Archaeoglobus sp.]
MKRGLKVLELTYTLHEFIHLPSMKRGLKAKPEKELAIEKMKELNEKRIERM